MNAQQNASLLVLILMLFVISYAMGMILGGHDMGSKIVKWELDKLLNTVRWILKRTLGVIIRLCRWSYNKL